MRLFFLIVHVPCHAAGYQDGGELLSTLLTCLHEASGAGGCQQLPEMLQQANCSVCITGVTSIPHSLTLLLGAFELLQAQAQLGEGASFGRVIARGLMEKHVIRCRGMAA